MLPCCCKALFQIFAQLVPILPVTRKSSFCKSKRSYIVVTVTDEWNLHLVLMFLNQSSKFEFFTLTLYNLQFYWYLHTKQSCTQLRKYFTWKYRLSVQITRRFQIMWKHSQFLHFYRNYPEVYIIQHDSKTLTTKTGRHSYFLSLAYFFPVIVEQMVVVDREEHNGPTKPLPSFKFWKFNIVVDYF